MGILGAKATQEIKVMDLEMDREAVATVLEMVVHRVAKTVVTVSRVAVLGKMVAVIKKLRIMKEYLPQRTLIPKEKEATSMVMLTKLDKKIL